MVCFCFLADSSFNTDLSSHLSRRLVLENIDMDRTQSKFSKLMSLLCLLHNGLNNVAERLAILFAILCSRKRCLSVNLFHERHILYRLQKEESGDKMAGETNAEYDDEKQIITFSV